MSVKRRKKRALRAANTAKIAPAVRAVVEENYEEPGVPRLDAAPELDMSEFLDDLSDLDFTEEQKRRFLETLIAILWIFVQLGIDGGDICEKLYRDAQGPKKNDVNSGGSSGMSPSPSLLTAPLPGAPAKGDAR